jgi:hypothetical protein
MLLLSEQIGAACVSLLQSKNPDGGIDSIHFGATSGCWTTASALWSMNESCGIAHIGLTPIRDMARFLIGSQIATGDEQGGWPMLPGANACSMSTGHSIAALVGCRHLLDTDSALVAELDRVVALGLKWLERWQNPDGGWGPQPASSTQSQSGNSLVFSTHYALMGFWRETPQTAAYASMKSKAIKFLVAARNKDGSWGKSTGNSGDVSDTARALITLVKCGAYAPADNIIKAAGAYILRKQGKQGLWPLGRIELLFPRSGGITVFTNNRTLDALQALSVLKAYDKTGERALSQGLEWLLSSQETSTGTWFISSPYDPPNKDLHTWPTAEWLYTLAVVARAYTSFAVRKAPVLASVRSAILLPVVAVASLVAGWLAGANWNLLSENTRQLILVGVVLAIAVNLVSGLMSNSIATWWRQVRGDNKPSPANGA